MYLTGLTHRDELFDLTARWLNDDFREGDGRIITEIFLYEGFISGSFVIHRMVHFLRKVFGANLEMDRIRQKHILRERLIQYVTQPTGRTDELVQSFRENPEFFFPRLPVDAVLVVADKKQLVSIGRIKRLSRVAEKVSFRLMDGLFQDIKAEAGHIAEKRAAAAGLPLASLISSPDAMRQDFIKAETAIAARFREKSMQLKPEAFTINDMLGFKIIAEPEGLVGYLIEYLLTLAMAPVINVPELPIKIYGRYLPETIRAIKCDLFGNDIDGSLLNAFCLVPECTEDFCLSTSRETSNLG